MLTSLVLHITPTSQGRGPFCPKYKEKRKVNLVKKSVITDWSSSFLRFNISEYGFFRGWKKSTLCMLVEMLIIMDDPYRTVIYNGVGWLRREKSWVNKILSEQKFG
jgi:hypothetical protein